MESLRGGVVILLDATDRAVAAELVALQRASYAVEAELIGSDQIPGLRESVEELVTAGLVWLGVLEGGRLAAALAYARLAGAADVDRLVVAPWAFRRGYGRALVTQLIELEPAGRFRDFGRCALLLPRTHLRAEGPKLTHQFFSCVGLHDTRDVSALGQVTATTICNECDGPER